LIDFVGAVIELYNYDAYGNALGFDPNQALTGFLYSGEQFDSKIGQQYLRARYYDPITSRFNRLDPFLGNLNDPQSLHKYLYTHGDPVNGIDPSGFNVEVNPSLRQGQRVHVAVSTLYKTTHPGNTVYFGCAIPGLGGFILPDILDKSLGQIGEIKPLSDYGFRKGELQVNAAISLANGFPTIYNNVLHTPQVASPHDGPQTLWIPMTWEPIGITVPIGTKQAAMIIGTMNGVLYYLVIPTKETESAPIPVPTPVTEPVLKPIALDILRDMTSGLALDPIQQTIYSIKIEYIVCCRIASTCCWRCCFSGKSKPIPTHNNNSNDSTDWCCNVCWFLIP
jgi:RHS repeat-associated protein